MNRSCSRNATRGPSALAHARDVLQDMESDTGYDTRRRVPDGVLARLSQTAVYDTR